MFHTSGQLFKNAFSTEEMRELFTEPMFVQRFMDVEAALARVEADVGLIPEDAAAEITNTASLDTIDMDDVERTVAEIDLFTVAIIQTWKEAIGAPGEYIHWGATSQDIADTAMVLLMREALDAFQPDLDAIEDALESLSERYAETPMVGRTHHVHALPITFGLKTATWLDEFRRNRARLETAAENCAVLQFFGAVGTLSSLGEDGLAVQKGLAEELDLSLPNTAWYASRDRLVELLDSFAALSGTLSRIARQVLVLGREEIGEFRERPGEGEIGSSTMPHKRNPIKAERIVGLTALIRGQSWTMDTLVDAYDERDAGLWYAEYAALPGAFMYLGRVLRYGNELLSDLEVNPDRMEENLGVHDGLVTSEAVMMALGDAIGRVTAHDIVYEVAVETATSERTFIDCLRADERVTDALSDEELEALTNPLDYTGVSDVFVRRVLDDR